ncbi:hypothetical protein [Legionella spiritensis]|uniref:LphB n=1 Tax=Legionella spiritensis TaxID=452 RepID=A0A0W0ZAM6_LEGSP|nr:hypothetical protein [Legionella spiritensis]KTD66197.1 LphB [Legionella spiritensis]SNV35185.1 LphB [Legionella spiritensis]
MRKHWFFISLLALAFGYLLILQVAAIWDFTIDDMYITLRYARNWAHGDGLLWNIGEEPVEGYSNFSFLIIAAAAIRIGLDPVIVLKSMGVVGLVFATGALYFLSRLWVSVWLAFIPCLWLLLYNGEIIWSVSGLETTVYQAFLAMGLLCLLMGVGYRFVPSGRRASQRRYAISAGFLFFLAALTRPEAPAVVAVFYGVALFDSSPVSKRSASLEVWVSGLVFAVLFLPYFLWRWHYYGYLLPNPVYCKGFGSGDRFVLDIEYLQLAWPFLLLTLPAILRSAGRRHYYFWLPSVVYLLLLIGADSVVAFANRLFLPAFLLLLPLSVAGLNGLVCKFIAEKGPVYTFAMALAVFWVSFFFIPKTGLAGFRFFTENPRAGETLRTEVARWLHDNIPASHDILLADSGMIPYLGSHRYIDSYCLNNKKMVTLPEANRYLLFCEQILAEKPDVIILTALVENKKTIYTPTDRCLHHKLIKNQAYRLQASFKTGDRRSFYQYEIYTPSR